MPSSTAVELVAPGDAREAVAAQRVERDVDAAQAGGGEVVGDEAQRGAVGGEGEVDGRRRRAQRGQLLDEHGQVGPHGRLAAGEADAVEAEALDAARRATRAISSKVSSSSRGSHCIPSSGMQ